MAKTLHYRRHSKKAPDNTLSPEGMALAVAEGNKLALKTKFARLFHGQLVRTAQTAKMFCSGLGYAPEFMPAVAEMGDDKLFAEVATPEFRQAVKEGASNFQAVIAVHGEAKARELGGTAVDGIMKMFEATGEGEVAVAFGHSPMIELAAYWVEGHEMPVSLTTLSDLEGITFYEDCDEKGFRTIRVGDKISVAA